MRSNSTNSSSNTAKPTGRNAPRAKTENQVRIIGGAWRRSVLRFPPVEGLRPTPDRVRETLFNWLGQDLSGLTCLDLFSGTGALALEAASRGALRVVAVERSAQAARAIEAHGQRLGATGFELKTIDAVSFLLNSREAFDVIFFDPPYASDLYARCAPFVAARLNQQGRLYLEASEEFREFAGLQRVKHQRAGVVHAHLFCKDAE